MSWIGPIFLKSTLLLGLAWVASLLFRRAAAELRHQVWLAALAGVVLVALPLPAPVQVQVPAVFTFTALSEPAGKAGHGSPEIWTIVWLAGATLLFARLCLGLVTIALWTKRAEGEDGLLWSDRARTPLTWGILRPVILFPMSARDWTAHQVDLARRHEEAHIARHDWLWQTFANLTRAVFWFHPLVWFAVAQLRKEAETATDDLVLASGAAPVDYAEQLLEVARNLSTATPSPAVPMIRAGALEARVRSILNPRRQRRNTSVVLKAAITILLAVVAAGLATLTASAEKLGLSEILAQTPRILVPSVEIPPKSAPTAASVPVRAAESSPDVDLPPHKVDEPGVTPPRLLYRVEPGYTEEARSAKLQGRVVLSLVIDPEGRAEEIQVVESLDPGLDQRAVEAVRNWAFEPGHKDGVPVPVRATIEVNFRLL